MTAEESIRQTIHQYILVHGKQDVEGTVALFAEDATMSHTHADRGGPLRGREAIRAFYQESADHHVPGRQSKLLCTNSIITINGDEGTAVSDVVILQRDRPDAEWRIDRLLKWNDRFVNRGGHWLYAQKAGSKAFPED